MKRLLLLTALALSLLLFGIGPCDDADAECVSYCETYWTGDPARYQACLEGCKGVQCK